MIEIATKSWKPSETDKKFMDACAEIDHNPPATWSKYDNPSDIVKMEYEEMTNAMKNNDMKSYKENLIHLSVALLHEWRCLHDE